MLIAMIPDETCADITLMVECSSANSLTDFSTTSNVDKSFVICDKFAIVFTTDDVDRSTIDSSGQRYDKRSTQETPEIPPPTTINVASVISELEDILTAFKCNLTQSSIHKFTVLLSNK
jgi:hypothetical protein